MRNAVYSVSDVLVDGLLERFVLAFDEAQAVAIDKDSPMLLWWVRFPPSDKQAAVPFRLLYRPDLNGPIASLLEVCALASPLTDEERSRVTRQYPELIGVPERSVDRARSVWDVLGQPSAEAQGNPAAMGLPLRRIRP